MRGEWALECVRLVLVICVTAQTAGGNQRNSTDGDGGAGEAPWDHALEHLLWDVGGAGGRGPPQAQARAAAALARLWQDDAEALCHLASAMASVGHTLRADATCRRALRVQPREPCAIFCVLHFALWTCDFDSVDALRARAVAAVESAVAAGPDAQPAGLGHLEALLVLPECLFARHLLQQTRFLGAASTGGIILRMPGPDAIGLQLLESGTGRVGSRALVVALLTSTARQHPHGYALLAALRGIRQHGGIEVKCFDTYPHAQEEDEVRVGIRKLCHGWAGMAAGTTAQELARAINGAGFLVTIDVDAWADSQGGGMHVAALTYRPSMLAVAALGVVSPTRASHHVLVSDAVSSSPDFLSSTPQFLYATHVASPSHPLAQRMLLYGHPAQGGQTSFVSPLAEDSTSMMGSTRVGGHGRAAAGASRKDLGLKEDALIVGCFHAEYKVSRDLVAAAASLLRRNERVLLWMGFMSALARASIERELHVHGVVAPQTRTAMLPGNIQGMGHLEAKAHADLALDSPVYSGHSSTADLVWAAVPTLTVPGVSQTTRLAASILLSQPPPPAPSIGQVRGSNRGTHTLASNRNTRTDKPRPGAAWVAVTLARNQDDLVSLGRFLVAHPHQLTHIRKQMADLGVSWGPFEVKAWAGRLVRGMGIALDLLLASASSSASASSASHTLDHHIIVTRAWA